MRVALIESDSGLLTVLERRFVALGWERRLLGHGVAPGQLTALRLHALIVKPALTGLDSSPPRPPLCPGWRCSCAQIRRRSPTEFGRCAPVPTTGSPSRATPTN